MSEATNPKFPEDNLQSDNEVPPNNLESEQPLYVLIADVSPIPKPSQKKRNIKTKLRELKIISSSRYKDNLEEELKTAQVKWTKKNFNKQDQV